MHLCVMEAPSQSPHLQRGRAGEEHACTFLSHKGCQILERNWRHRHLEVDIVACEAGTLIFVEVKTRQAGGLTEPWQAVDLKKQRNLIRAANAYIRQKKSLLEVRFDIISVSISNATIEIVHIPNAFQPRF